MEQDPSLPQDQADVMDVAATNKVVLMIAAM
jgi:hypothetical protein